MKKTAVGSQELWRRTFNAYCSKLPDFELLKLDIVKNQYQFLKMRMSLVKEQTKPTKEWIGFKEQTHTFLQI